MLITLSHRVAICESVARVQLTGVTTLEAVNHRINLIMRIYKYKNRITNTLANLEYKLAITCPITPQKEHRPL